MKLFETIKPKENLMIVGLQNNISFHDVNPLTEINGTRNTFYMATSSNVKIRKSLEDNSFNKKFNKNTYIPKGKNKLISILKNL